jgi:hypothetical protein
MAAVDQHRDGRFILPLLQPRAGMFLVGVDVLAGMAFADSLV